MRRVGRGRRRFDRAVLWSVLWVGLMCLLCVGGRAMAQHPRTSLQEAQQAALEASTQEHIESEAWWPTKSTSRLKEYAGSEACTRCHEAESSEPASSMRRAATPAVDARFLRGLTPQLVAMDGYSYRMTQAAGGIEYSVAGEAQRLAKSLDWVIGAGDLGRTFLYQSGGRWYQSRASFYTQPAALDITTGLGHAAHGAALPSALGELLSSKDASACFGCHTVHATTSAGLDPLHAEPGLGCEACHGPAREHVAGMSARQELAEKDARVFAPARLSPSDSIDFCGACHRSSADAKLAASVDTTAEVVRFQPYRLEESACWRTTHDERLTCVACHDPHKPLSRDLTSYDQHCVGCHSAAHAGANAEKPAAKVCPKATSGCVSCHMPKVTVASMHGDFTDHFIRIARAGEPFPK